jgi:hypothetical protein
MKVGLSSQRAGGVSEKMVGEYHEIWFEVMSNK